MPATLHPFNGWEIRPYFRNKHESSLTHQPINEELWLTLRHPAEVQDVGCELIARHCPASLAADRPAIWREFRGYVRQAENFYRGAKVLPWMSSPLNYYYAFLNLAKAYCLIAGALPPIPAHGAVITGPRRIRHGLSEEVLLGTPDRWQVTVRGELEVFPLLYALSLGTEIADGTKLDVHSLLGYSIPVQWQLKESSHSNKVRSFPSLWVLCFEPQAWDIVGILRAAPAGLFGTAFDKHYEPLEHDAIKNFARQVWSLPARDASMYQFYQRRVPHPPVHGGGFSGDALQEGLDASLPHRVFEHLTANDFQFLLCLPSESANCPGTAIWMNQEVASYAVMFFLSSLVRYHPEYMDAIAQKSDAWLIESFVKSAPIEVLRSLTAKILGYTIVMRHCA